MVASGKPTGNLASGVESNPGARYLQPAKSCATTWRYHAPGAPVARHDPQYVVYLGPYDTNRACEIRMQGTHKGDFVTMLSAGSTDMVQCICHVDLADAPTLRPNMTVDATASIWIRQLQGMFRDAHLLPDVTGVYDQATQDVVRSQLATYDPQASGTVDAGAWRLSRPDVQPLPVSAARVDEPLATQHRHHRGDVERRRDLDVPGEAGVHELATAGARRQGGREIGTHLVVRRGRRPRLGARVRAAERRELRRRRPTGPRPPDAARRRASAPRPRRPRSGRRPHAARSRRRSRCAGTLPPPSPPRRPARTRSRTRSATAAPPARGRWRRRRTPGTG